MEHSSNLVAKAAREMDSGIAGVMPADWHGHARLTISEQDDLSPKQAEFAKRLSRRLLDKKDVSAEVAGRVAAKKAREKLD